MHAAAALQLSCCRRSQCSRVCVCNFASALCAAGFGAPKPGDTCKPCGGGTYGHASRTTTPCLLCPADRTYTFTWADGAETFTPRAVSKDAATTLDDCIAEFVQAEEDGAFYLDIPGGALVVDGSAGAQYLLVPNVKSLDTCVAACRDSGVCVAVTFDASLTCHRWEPLPHIDWSRGG